MPTGESGVATDLAAFVASLSDDDVPDDARRLAERAILDTVGVTLAGTGAEGGTVAASATAAETGETTVLGRDRQLPLSDAVFANATAGHALDFDDVALAAMDGHPSVPMVALLLAVGEREGATGRDVLTAFVAGFEAQHFLSRPISPGHYEGGWHATPTIGLSVPPRPLRTCSSSPRPRRTRAQYRRLDAGRPQAKLRDDDQVDPRWSGRSIGHDRGPTRCRGRNRRFESGRRRPWLFRPLSRGPRTGPRAGARPRLALGAVRGRHRRQEVSLLLLHPRRDLRRDRARRGVRPRGGRYRRGSGDGLPGRGRRASPTTTPRRGSRRSSRCRT